MFGYWPVERSVRFCRWALAVSRFAFHFPAFPNYHIRTNAFLLRRSLGVQLKWPPTWSKLDAYRLESGRNGITAQVMRMGLGALVVGRDGVGYGRDDWHRSNTFWHGDQGNLLVDDNQTRAYTQGDVGMRMKLFRYAWGGRSSLLPIEPLSHA
jgi:hypothetical protein